MPLVSIFGRRRPLAKGILTQAAEVIPEKPLEFVPGYLCPACGAETMHEWAGYAHRCDTCKQEVMKDARQPASEDQ